MDIFCRIANKEIKTDLLYEDDLVMAFNDIHPLAPVHVLIIPKEHIESIADLEDEDEKLMGRMIMAAKKIAEDLKIDSSGYKLLFRVKENSIKDVTPVPHNGCRPRKVRRV